MRFRCPKEVWHRGVIAVKNAVGSPISNPMVENIFVSCKGQIVSFMATNLSLTIRCDREAQVEEEGEIALPTKVIIDLVNDLPIGEVSFDCKETDVDIRCGRFKGVMKGQLGEQFPPFLPVTEGQELSIPVGPLRSAIRRTIFATSTEKSRFELDGIKIDLHDGAVFFVATDGRRLAQVAYKSEDLPKETMEILVPTKTMAELLNSLPDEGDVRIIASERRVMFSCGDLTVASNLLTDKFPPYDKIIPRDSRFVATFDREVLLGAVRRVADLTNTETNLVILGLREGELTIHGERAEVGGRGEEPLQVDYNGEPMDIRYNYRFLVDILRILSEDKVTLDLWDERRPGVMRALGQEDYLYVLMPMKRPEEMDQETE
ncbi:MAG: DNA polymerase III subunit beta [bacterium]